MKITVTRTIDVPAGDECLNFGKHKACKHRTFDYCKIFNSTVLRHTDTKGVLHVDKCTDCLNLSKARVK